MLRNVLEDYLKSINERDFDYPLSSLLQAMDFYDIHFTHGRNEFGKDFIAKRLENGVVYQYSIQSKKGDINQSDFRNDILGQLLEASILGIGHPQFDKSLPRQVVFVTTGRLVGNAPLAFQDMNSELKTVYQKNEVTFWGHERIIEFSEKYGLSGIHQNTAINFSGLAQFFSTYGKALEGSLSDREIEAYSRLWLDESLEFHKRILWAAIEGEIIATRLVEGGHLYEAMIAYLGFARVILQVAYENDDNFVVEIYKELVERKLLPLCKLFFAELKSEMGSSRKLFASSVP